MRAYVMTTGVLFGLLALLHAWRLIEEGLHVDKSPWFVLITVAAAGLCIWAWRLLKLSPRS